MAFWVYFGQMFISQSNDLWHTKNSGKKCHFVIQLGTFMLYFTNISEDERKIKDRVYQLEYSILGKITRVSIQ